MTPEKFATNVTNAYEDERGIFANRVNAEELVPQNCSNKEKALFLFYVLQLDYATKSQKLYEGANRLFLDNRNFFKPSYILNLAQKDLEKALKTYLRPRYINEAKRRYKANSSLLMAKYDSDPRKIFEKSRSARKSLKRVGEFRGFGPKIGNFFVRTMINVFNYDFKDIDQILPPVDVHDVRIAHLMGYVESDSMTQQNVQKVKELWSKSCKEAGVSWLTFDKALWLLGSEGRPKTKSEILKLIGMQD